MAFPLKFFLTLLLYYVRIFKSIRKGGSTMAEYLDENKELTPEEQAELELKAQRKKMLLNIWDHFTTGLLILLMASPFLILLYIFLWFV